MSEEIKVGYDQFTVILKNLDAKVRKHVGQAINVVILNMQTVIRTIKLQGGNPLHQRTGNLVRSIHVELQQRAEALLGRVYASSTAWYARIHEFGATFTRTNLFGREVEPYTVVMPERSFLRTTLKEFRVKTHDAIQAAMNAAAHA